MRTSPRRRVIALGVQLGEQRDGVLAGDAGGLAELAHREALGLGRRAGETTRSAAVAIGVDVEPLAVALDEHAAPRPAREARPASRRSGRVAPARRPRARRSPDGRRAGRRCRRPATVSPADRHVFEPVEHGALALVEPGQLDAGIARRRQAGADGLLTRRPARPARRPSGRPSAAGARRSAARARRSRSSLAH